MKLTEALSLHADLQKRVRIQKLRLKKSLKVQEDHEPAEHIKELYKEQDSTLAQLQELTYRINKIS